MTVRWGGSRAGSVVGIQRLRKRDMHTGTLISDLMATVERAEMRGERTAEQRRIFDEWEWNQIYGLQSTTNQQEVFRGAA
jgi:hypothetical protein